MIKKNVYHIRQSALEYEATVFRRIPKNPNIPSELNRITCLVQQGILTAQKSHAQHTV